MTAPNDTAQITPPAPSPSDQTGGETAYLYSVADTIDAHGGLGTTARMRAAIAALSTAHARVARLENQCDNLAQTIEAMNRMRTEDAATVARLEEERDAYRVGAEDFREQLDDARAEIERAKGELDELREDAQQGWRASRETALDLDDALARLAASEREGARLREALEKEKQDAARWRLVKPGLFVTPHPDGDPEVVYQSGWLDEFAQELWPTLTRGDRDIAWDVTPVVDAALAASPTERPSDG